MQLSLTKPPPAPRPKLAPGWSASALPARARLGSFEIQRVIARGTATAIYLATDQALGVPVVIQEYLPGRLVQRDEQQRLHAVDSWYEDLIARGLRAFIDDARMMARCDHASLVRVLQLFEANGTAYRVMPYCEGQRLLDLRNETHAAPDEGALRVLLNGLLGALEAIHRTGHVHGGVSPANILFLNNDRALLLGPGTAGRLIDDEAAQAQGTGQKRSFDAAEPGVPAADPRIDLYSLAEVARFYITGEMPASAGASDERAPLADAIDKAFEPAARPHYSAALLDTLELAMSPAAADRPINAARFRDGLDRDAAPGARPAVPSAAPKAPERAPARTAPSPAVPPPRTRAPAAAPAAPATRAPAAGAPAASASAAGASATRAPTARRRRTALVTGATSVVGIAAFAVAMGAWHLMPQTGSEQPAQAPRGAASLATVERFWSEAVARVESGRAAAPPAPRAPLALPAPTEPAAPPAANDTSSTVASTVPDPARLIAVAPTGAGAAETTSASVPAPPRPAPRAPSAARPVRLATSTVSAVSAGPRAVCALKTQFALYRCMQVQCKSPQWSGHVQCQRLRETDAAD